MSFAAFLAIGAFICFIVGGSYLNRIERQRTAEHKMSHALGVGLFWLTGIILAIAAAATALFT